MRRAMATAAGPILAVLALLAVATPATAHPAGEYYGPRWPSGVFEPYFIATGVPTQSRVTTAINNGAAQWNNVGEPMDFSYQGRSTQSIIQYPACPANGHSYVFQRDIGTFLGETYECIQGGFTASFIMTFDTIGWYSDTGTPPSTAYDRWSVASHEFGHATGFGDGTLGEHWPDNSTRCQGNSVRLTMCRFTPQGSTMMRDLGDHDIHTFQAAY